ncbi:MAG: hypothetical protein AAFX56_09025 [Pseudomonadota bacterium]
MADYEENFFPSVTQVRGSVTDLALDDCLIIDGYVVAGTEAGEAIPGIPGRAAPIYETRAAA